MSQAGSLENATAGGANVQKINVQTGTSPVVAANNTITFNGAVVAAGTHPVRTDGTGANTMALEVQTAQAIASTDATKIGLAAFNSADFTVDANGFVSTTGSSGITTIDGNTGSVTGSTVSIATPASTGTFNFSGTGTALTLNLMDGSGDLAVGNSSSATGGNSVVLGTSATDNAQANSVVIGNSASIHSTGAASVAIGLNSFVAAGSGVAIGSSAAANQFGVSIGLSSGSGSGVAIGRSASATGGATSVSVGSFSSSTGNETTCLGSSATSTGSTSCTCIGASCNDNGGTSTTLLGVSANGGSAGSTMALGVNSGTSNATGGSNIYLNNVGVSAESHVIRIGTQGSGTAQQNSCFLAGITGSTPTSANTPQVVLCDNAGNLTTISSGTSGFVLTSNGTATPSFQAASGGSGITTINGDSGSVTGSTVTVTSGLSTQNSGSTVSFSGSGTTLTMNLANASNTILGHQAGNGSLTGTGNSAVGGRNLQSLTNGSQNSAFGYSALIACTSGTQNTALGSQSLILLAGGSQNTSLGENCLPGITSGSNNIGIGFNAGSSMTSGSESSNIILGNAGVFASSNRIVIGTQGSSTGQQNVCLIAGIEGATYINGSPTPALAYCDTGDGQLVATQAVSSSTATSTFGSLVVGTARQNTANYAILVNVSMAITAAAGATIVMGVGSTSTPSTNTVVSSFSVAETISFSAFVPAGYYMLVNTTGTITVGSITTQTCAVG